MDTTETYIKMCEKAEDILPHHNIEAEDFLGNSKTRKESVWLLRQDQLQEMVESGKYPCQLSSDFYYWHTSQDWSNVNTFTSMEQLWLAFVMKEKYNKTWDGEKWC